MNFFYFINFIYIWNIILINIFLILGKIFNKINNLYLYVLINLYIEIYIYIIFIFGNY